MGPVVAAIGDGIWRPGGARQGARGIDPLVAVDRRIEERAQGLGIVDDAAEEIIREFGEAELPLRVVEEVGLAALVPD